MKIFIATLLMILSTQAFAEDHNIISITAGVQTFEEETVTSTGTNTSSTTIKARSFFHKKTKTNTTNNSTSSSTSKVVDQNDAVFGLQYQRKVGAIWLGALVQTNETYSMSLGVGF